MFQAKADAAVPRFCELPINSLCPFRTADIGFHPYPPEKLRAFSQQLAEQGIYERIIVRPVPNSEQYEILAGHNRTRAWRLTGHQTIGKPAGQHERYRISLDHAGRGIHP